MVMCFKAGGAGPGRRYAGREEKRGLVSLPRPCSIGALGDQLGSIVQRVGGYG